VNRPAPTPVVFHVDTGTDDAAMLLWALTAGEVDTVAVLTGWGNVSEAQACRNTLAVLAAAGAGHVPVHRGLDETAAGPRPAGLSAAFAMDVDGLGGVALPDGPPPSAEPAVDALLRLTAERPGELVLLGVAPFTTLAVALDQDPALPGRLAGVTVMGGSVAAGGNLTPAAEANVGHDPEAAARVVRAFGRPGALAGGAVPRMVPLDVTYKATVDEALVEAAGRSPLAGAAALHRIWEACLPRGELETGRHGLPVHDLLAVYAAVHPEVCTWRRLPLEVDTAGGAAWGATVADRRVPVAPGAGLSPGDEARRLAGLDRAPAVWDVALDVDVVAFRAALHRWLAGSLGAPGP